MEKKFFAGIWFVRSQKGNICSCGILGAVQHYLKKGEADRDFPAASLVPHKDRRRRDVKGARYERRSEPLTE